MRWDEQLASALAASLTQGNLLVACSLALAGGLLTSLTPCVYPLIPVTLRYFGGMDASRRGRVFGLAVAYVFGMVLLYAALGTTFAALNKAFGTFVGSPWVLAGIAVFCTAMGLSMLGVFTLQLPSSLATRLAQIGGPTPTGAFGMGVASGFIAAPCTGPVLTVILALIAGTGRLGFGFALMVSFALGLGIPFLLLAVFSGNLSRLPHGGPWMEVVKVSLATAMFLVAFYFLGLAWPGAAELIAHAPRGPVLGGVLMVLGAAALVAYLRVSSSPIQLALKGGAVLALTSGLALACFAAPEPSAGPAAAWLSSHDDGLALATRQGKPVILDFSAEWCAACKELERHTFPAPEVASELGRFVTVRVDATETTPDIERLFERYGVLGLPTVVFIDSRGTVLSRPRVTGFVEASRFAELMRSVR